jgi:hypothetical protein
MCQQSGQPTQQLSTHIKPTEIQVSTLSLQQVSTNIKPTGKFVPIITKTNTTIINQL